MSLLRVSDLTNVGVSYGLHMLKFLKGDPPRKEAIKSFLISVSSRKAMEMYPDLYGQYAVLPAEYMMASLMSVVFDVVSKQEYDFEKLIKSAAVQVGIQFAGDQVLKLAGKPDSKLL